MIKWEEILFFWNVFLLVFEDPTMVADSKLEWRRSKVVLHQKHILNRTETKEIRVLIRLADKLHKILSFQV